MKVLGKIALLTVLATGIAAAQTNRASQPNHSSQAGSPQSSYISVMSKAGTPTPRPQVPVRYVGLPPGAGAGYDYYYGYGRSYGGGSAAPSYADQSSPSTSTTLPGYDTRPRTSRGRDSVVGKRRRP